MTDSTDSLKLDEHLARLLAALDSGFEGGNSRAPTVSLEARQAEASKQASSLSAAEGSLSELLPDDAGSSVERVWTLPTGQPVRISRFELRRQLGKGGCGIVFLAYDPKLKREVALKIPRPEMLLSEEARKRLIREARAAAEFDHPNLVPVYETGEFGPLCYIATAFCPGQTLGQWLERQAFPVPVRQAARLVAIVAEAVQHAHDRGVLHRDLKPNNIILQPVREDPLAEEPPPGSCQLRGEYFIPRVVDFGLAKLMERSEPSDTRTWQILGTPRYMAPEQAMARHHDLGPAADVYALGAILYELLCGCPPFDGASEVEVLRQVVDGRLRPPRQIRPDIPRDLEAICLKAMEKSPGRRYRTAIDLADDLRRFLEGKPTLARPLNWLGRAARWARRNDQLVALIVVSTIAVIMIGVGTWYMGETRRLKNDQERTRSDLELRSRYERQRDYARYMHAAYLSLRSGNRGEALDYLEAARLLVNYLNEPPDFSFLYLKRLAQLPRRDIPAFKTPAVAVAVAPEHRWLCWFDREGTFTLWDLENNSPLATWQAPTSQLGSSVSTLSFVGPHPNILWTDCGSDGPSQVGLWRVEAGNRVIPQPRLPEVFRSPWRYCATSPDGRFSCLVSADGQLRCWDWFEQKEVANTHWSGMVQRLAVCSLERGWRVLLATTDGRLWRWEGAKHLQALPPIDGGGELLAMTFAPHGQPAVGTSQGMWVLEAEGSWRRLESGPIRMLVPTSRGLVASAKAGRFRYWEQGQRWGGWFVTAEQGEVTAAVTDRTGRWLATVGKDGFIRTWQLPDDIATLGIYDCPALERVVTNSALPQLILKTTQHRYYERRGVTVLALAYPALPIADAVLASDGSLEVLLTNGASVCLEQWKEQRRQVRGKWQLPKGAEAVYARWLSACGWVLVADGHGQVFLWKADEIAAEPLVIAGPHQQPLTQAAMTADANWLALRWGSAIAIWSLPERNWKMTLTPADGVSDFCFVERMGLLATAGERGAVRLWSMESGREAGVLLGHIGAATALAVSPDQRTLISGGANGEIIFWDLQAQREVYRQRRHDVPVRQIVFANQGRWLVTVAADQLALWQADE